MAVHWAPHRQCTSCRENRIIVREIQVPNGPHESLCAACAAMDDLAGLIPRMPQYMVDTFAATISGLTRTWREIISLWEALHATISSDSAPEDASLRSGRN